MASAEDYAGWIVQNADKKGTPEFDTVSKAYQAARQPKTEAAPATTEPQAEPSASGFISGNLNKGIAQLAGMPVDAARNALNLGIAGYGTAKGMLGGKDLPQPLEPGPGGSEWFEKMMGKGGLIGPSATPESAPGRYGAAALQALPSALMGRPSMGQLPRAATAAVSSGLGSELGKDIAPAGAEQAGSVIGSMLPGARRMGAAPGPGERASAERKAEQFGKAKELGIAVPPREMKPDPVQQKIQNALAQELKLPEGTELSPKTLQDYRTAKYKEGYEPVMKEKALNGVIAPTMRFKREINKIEKDERSLRDEFPESVKDVGLQKVLSDFKQDWYTTRGAMEQVKRLRESATHNLSSPSANDDTMRLGLHQRNIANAMETLIEDNLEKVGKTDVMEKFREARTAIAKTHAIESSLDPATRKINPNKLSALQTEGVPLTGQLKKLSEVTAAFPSAVKPAGPATSEDLFTHRVTPMAITHPPAMAAHWASRLLDPLTKSAPYQALSVDPKAKMSPEQERFMRLLIGTQRGNQIDNPPQ